MLSNDINQPSVFSDSTFSISAEEQEMGTELKVTLLQPCEGLSKQGKE